MSAYVYKTAVKCGSSNQVLRAVRAKVKKLKKTYPKLASCSLADMSLSKKKAALNVTLYFKRDT